MKAARKPVLVGMVGLVGSGKSTVAKELARHLAATVVWQDGVRLALRKQNGSYKTAEVDRLADAALAAALSIGGNAIDDGDAVSPRNRKRLAALAKRNGARLFFIRVVCNPDKAFGRIVAARADPYFSEATSPFQGSARTKSAAIKFRELWRRTPLHYVWSIPRESSRWTLKRLPHRFAGIVDTSSPSWKRDISHIARKILKQSEAS